MEVLMHIKDSITIHQPHFFPWPPYIARVVLSEIFVVLDDVSYRKNYFQNRTKLIDKKGSNIWLTLPISKQSNCLIKETRLTPNYEYFLRKSIKTIEQNYSKYPYFSKIWGTVKEYLMSIGSNEQDNLAIISTDSIILTCSLLEIQTPMILFSSELDVQYFERTNRILRIIELTNKKTYLTGWGGGANPNIHDIKLLTNNGITIKSMNKAISISKEADFILNPGTSILHWIFTKGTNYVKERLIEYKEAML